MPLEVITLPSTSTGPAVTAAVNAFNKELLASHIRTCVAEDIRAGRDETIDELAKILQRTFDRSFLILLQTGRQPWESIS